MDGEEMASPGSKVAPVSAINVITKFLPQKRIEQLLVGVFDISISHIDYRYIDTF